MPVISPYTNGRGLIRHYVVGNRICHRDHHTENRHTQLAQGVLNSLLVTEVAQICGAANQSMP